MGSTKVSGILLFTLTLLLINLTEAKHGKNLPSAVVVGTVYCDTCSQQDSSRASNLISGASVAVKCSNGNLETSFYKEVKTNEHGAFEVHLPTGVSKHVKSIQGCAVKLINSNKPSCDVASSTTSPSFQLKGRKDGAHVFSAGSLAFKPLKQPELCNEKLPTLPTVPTLPTLPTPLPTLPVPTLPVPPMLPTLPTPLPTLPVPELPLPLPPTTGLPGIPKLPVPIPELPPTGIPKLPVPIPELPPTGIPKLPVPIPLPPPALSAKKISP